MEVKPLHSELLFQGRAFTLRREQVQMPNGSQSLLEIVEHRPSVTILPLDETGLVWFIEQYRHPARRVILELPAGVIEANETPVECAQRELREEIGMSAAQLVRIGGGFLAPGYSTEFNHFFLATELKPDPLPGDEGEFLSVRKTSWHHALKMAQDGEIEDAKTLAALFQASFVLGISK